MQRAFQIFPAKQDFFLAGVFMSDIVKGPRVYVADTEAFTVEGCLL